MDFKIETHKFPLGLPDDLGNGVIHHCHALSDGESNVPAHLRHGFLGLIFNLRNNISYTVGDNFSGTLPKRHYVMAYIPPGHCELTTETGKHSLFCMEFITPWLDKLMTLFPAFASFVKNAAAQSHPLLSQPYRTTPRVLSEIEFTLNHDLYGAAGELLVGIKYMLISMECFKQIETFDPEEADLDKVQEAYEYLRKNIRFSCNVNALADRVDISTKKLESAFKRIYGQTVYKALTIERLNRSVAYLRDTNLPINEIAALVGYKNPDVFSSTFKRNFGYPPADVRKKANRDPNNSNGTSQDNDHQLPEP